MICNCEQASSRVQLLSAGPESRRTGRRVGKCTRPTRRPAPGWRSFYLTQQALWTNNPASARAHKISSRWRPHRMLAQLPRRTGFASNIKAAVARTISGIRLRPRPSANASGAQRYGESLGVSLLEAALRREAHASRCRMLPSELDPGCGLQMAARPQWRQCGALESVEVVTSGRVWSWPAESLTTQAPCLAPVWSRPCSIELHGTICIATLAHSPSLSPARKRPYRAPSSNRQSGSVKLGETNKRWESGPLVRNK